MLPAFSFVRQRRFSGGVRPPVTAKDEPVMLNREALLQFVMPSPLEHVAYS